MKNLDNRKKQLILSFEITSFSVRLWSSSTLGCFPYIEEMVTTKKESQLGHLCSTRLALPGFLYIRDSPYTGLTILCCIFSDFVRMPQVSCAYLFYYITKI